MLCVAEIVQHTCQGPSVNLRCLLFLREVCELLLERTAYSLKRCTLCPIQSLAYLVFDLLMEEASVEMLLPGDSGSPQAQRNLFIWVALLSLPLLSWHGGGDAAENLGLPGERMGLRKKEKIGSQTRFPYLFFFFFLFFTSLLEMVTSQKHMWIYVCQLLGACLL